MERAVVAAALLLSTAVPTYADVVIEDIKPAGQAISITGVIGPDDFEQFKLKASPLVGKRMVALNSPGGNVIAALQIGEFVRLRGWLTFVFNECDSACALIWLAGTPRMMMSNAKVGFHAASVNGQEKGAGNALVGAYMTKLGLGYEAIYWATTSAPSDIAYLTPRKAKEIGIDVELVEPDEKQANAQPTLPITPRPVIPQPLRPAPARKPGRDCSGVSQELRQFFSSAFKDCNTPKQANAKSETDWVTRKAWDRYIPSTNRYITFTLQWCGECNGVYRLIQKDHDANGRSNFGSICYFKSEGWSDCESTAGSRYQLAPSSINLFVDIVTGKKDPAP
jgi:hypothetical protein